MEKLQEDFIKLREFQEGEKRVKAMLTKYEANMEKYLAPWIAFSKDAKYVYPSQGLLLTPYDYISYHSLQMLPLERVVQTLRMRMFFLTMFNHPYRMKFLKKVDRAKFSPPPKVKSGVIKRFIGQGLGFSIGDLGAVVVGGDRERVSRTQRYGQGPFIKLGKQARSLFVGSASPDVWNSAAAISTMAASHCLSAIPRNGLMSDVKRQVDLAAEVFDWLKILEKELLSERKDKKVLSDYWKKNVCGTLPAEQEKALERAIPLYEVGVRTFRVYSPEPGFGLVKTVKALRHEFGEKIEIFAGQVISVEQAKMLEVEGADGIYIGIGGGGRCITGVRSGSVVDWPELLWLLRGEIKIPVIVEGGASDHVATTLLLGASGIGVSRVVAGGTIESPGGALYCSDKNGKLFKPYGGEASARTKYLDGKILPFNIPAFVEGETTQAWMSYVAFTHPTLTYNLHLLNEDAILALVFRSVDSIHQLQAIDPSPLRQITSEGSFQRNTH